jgi:Plasmid pRiA4b ORF-3-like protein
VDEVTVERATEPARWLLEMGVEGIPLTQTHALARAVVREGVQRWPAWWDTEVVGPPQREAEVRVLEALREGLRRHGLVRRRGCKLFTTKRGRALLEDPDALLCCLASDLDGGDEFGAVVASAVVDALAGGERHHDELASAAAGAARRDGWVDEAGRPPDVRDLSWDVIGVLCRGEAYGLIERRPDPAGPRWSTVLALTDSGTRALAATRTEPIGGAALLFEAELLNAPGVSARIAVGAEQHLTVVHQAIQEAFGWLDDHLYSFWLDGQFWSGPEHEYTSPIDLDSRGAATAELPIAELDLEPGAEIAYVFDFGDEWRVSLELRERMETDGGTYPRVIERVGEAPPQYG